MLSDLWYRLRAIVRRRSVERELDDELRFHVERQTQKHVGRGLPLADTARLARLEFGGLDLAKEGCRDARGVGLWERASRNVWKGRFGADTNIAGRQLRIGQASMPIVGVMPESFRFPAAGGGRLDAEPGRRAVRAGPAIHVVQGRRPRQAEPHAGRGASRSRPSASAVGPGPSGHGRQCRRARDRPKGRDRRRRRQHEISIGYSLGASRASIVGQLLTESLVLSVAGSLVGLAVAAAALRTFEVLGDGLPRVAELRLDWTLVAYSFGCAVGATLLFGLLPALCTAKRPTSQGLTGRNRSVAPSTHRLQWLLVGVQVAQAVPLLFGAGLLLRSFDALGRVAPGFEPDRVLTFRISGDWGETTDMKALQRRLNGTLASLRALPGVDAAATAMAAPGVPFEHQAEMRIVEGDTAANQRIMASTRVVSEGYFTTMRIPVVTGTACAPESPAPTAVVNRRFAALYLAGAAPLGRHVEHVPSTRSWLPPASSASSATRAKRGSTASRRRSSTGATPLRCPPRCSWFARRQSRWRSLKRSGASWASSSRGDRSTR